MTLFVLYLYHDVTLVLIIHNRRFNFISYFEKTKYSKDKAIKVLILLFVWYFENLF